MNFLTRLKAAFAQWMYGRYGSDQLGRVILIVSIVFLVLTNIVGIPLFYYLSIAGYVWALFRMFSRNSAQRSRENQWYLNKTGNLTRDLKQAYVRFRNRKQYKYFKCPQCGVRLRLTRGVGEKNIVCQKCHHSFRIKA